MFGSDTISVAENQLPLVLNPAVSGTAYIWSTGDTSQTIEVNNTGWYSVSVTNENGCIGSGEVYVEIRTGISEKELINSIILFPNPVNGILNITTENSQLKRFTIYNAIGEQLGYFESKGEINTFDTKELSKGIYFLKTETIDHKSIIKTFSVIP